MIRVYKCGPGYRTPTHTVPLEILMKQAVLTLPLLDAERLRDNLTLIGKARIKGGHDQWFEYEVLDEGEAASRSARHPL